MKIGSVFFLVLFFLSFAGEKYGVYDLQGNRISAFEAERQELPEKTRIEKARNPNRNLYISSMQKNKETKPSSRYRYKTEAGAYIEASRKETFSVCPDKEIQGTWISEYSVSMDKDNCLSVQAPSLAGTFRILFLGNSGRADTIQVLVEQSYIQMGDYSHQIWVPDSMPSWCYGSVTCEFPAYGHYENRRYGQMLIVDKTKLTMTDAQHYSEIYDIKLRDMPFFKGYAKNQNIDETKLPHVGYTYEAWMLANARSKNGGLDTAYRIIDKRDYGKYAGKSIILDSNAWKGAFFVLDTSVSGYRVPFENEWLFLMRAGASTRYYWGDEEDSATVSRYAWVKPIGLKPIAKLLPNRFGLYDMVGITDEWVESYSYYYYNEAERNFHEAQRNSYRCNPSCATYLNTRTVSPECVFIRKSGTLGPRYTLKSSYANNSDKSDAMAKRKAKTKKIASVDTAWAPRRVYYTGFRFVRKTPKLQKLEKF